MAVTIKILYCLVGGRLYL